MDNTRANSANLNGGQNLRNDEDRRQSSSEEINRLIEALDNIDETGGDALEELPDFLETLYLGRGIFDSLTISDCKRKVYTESDEDDDMDLDNEDFAQLSRPMKSSSTGSSSTASSSAVSSSLGGSPTGDSQNNRGRRGSRRGQVLESFSYTTIVPTNFEGKKESRTAIATVGDVSNSGPNQRTSRAA